MLDSRDNFCGCVDDAFVQTDEPLIDIRHNIGYKSTIAIKSSLSRYNKYFKGSSGLKNYDVLCCHYDTDGSRTPWWIAVLRNRVTGECVVNNFLVEWNSNTMSLQLQQCYPTEVERPEMVAADSKIAVLPHKDYLVIATGSDLWLYDYANDIQIKLGDLGGKQVKAMTAKDINNEKINGHLGVALDNGEFRVYEVNYNYEQPEAASLRELYRQHGFGDVVVIIFKYDSGSNLAQVTILICLYMKMRFIWVLCLILGCCGIGNCQYKANYQLAEKFREFALGGKMTKNSLSIHPKFIHRTDAFWFDFQTENGREYYLVNPSKKSKELLFDREKLAMGLSEYTKEVVDGKTLNFYDLDVSKDLRYVVFSFKGREYKYDRYSCKCASCLWKRRRKAELCTRI